MVMDLAVLLIAIALAILAAFLIPVLIELKKTTRALREFTVNLENDVKPALRELQETLVEVKGLVAEVTARTEEIKVLTTAMGETGHNLQMINRALGSVAGVFTNAKAWSAGAMAAIKMFAELYAKKRKGEG